MKDRTLTALLHARAHTSLQKLAEQIAANAYSALQHERVYCAEPLDCPVCRRRIERMVKGRMVME